MPCRSVSMSKSFVDAKVGDYFRPSVQTHFIVEIIAIPKPERRRKDRNINLPKCANSFHGINVKNIPGSFPDSVSQRCRRDDLNIISIA